MCTRVRTRMHTQVHAHTCTNTQDAERLRERGGLKWNHSRFSSQTLSGKIPGRFWLRSSYDDNGKPSTPPALEAGVGRNPGRGPALQRRLSAATHDQRGRPRGSFWVLPPEALVTDVPSGRGRQALRLGATSGPHFCLSLPGSEMGRTPYPGGCHAWRAGSHVPGARDKSG